MTSKVTIDGVTLTGETMDEIIVTLKRSAQRLEIKAAAGDNTSKRAAQDLRRDIRGLEIAKKAYASSRRTGGAFRAV